MAILSPNCFPDMNSQGKKKKKERKAHDSDTQCRVSLAVAAGKARGTSHFGREPGLQEVQKSHSSFRLVLMVREEGNTFSTPISNAVSQEVI